MSVIRSRAPNEVAQRIIAAAGQTADLLRVEREDGTEILRVDKDGNLSTSGTVGGASSAVVTHGLAATPGRIIVTGSSSDTAALYVTAVTATQFTVNAPAAVAGDRIVYWRAEL